MNLIIVKWLQSLTLFILPLLAFQTGTRLDPFEVFLTEYIYFIGSIILASMANVLFFSRNAKVTLKLVTRHLFISFFVGWISYLLGRNFNLTFELRLIIVSLMAFLSEFFLQWISEKYPRIFNRGLDRIFPPTEEDIKREKNEM